ncbi:MAG TPA: YggS family pyridoxal phosphate-dependent enzyme [Candidatus Binataceae bacterium]
MLTEREIAERLTAVRFRIDAALRRAGRDPKSTGGEGPANGVRLVLASKTQPPEAVRAAYRAGAREFGENYVQEAVAKRAALADLGDIRWHLIGHLQSNKARIAADTFNLIHSLDSVRLATALARARRSPPVLTLVEVNLGGEASKMGVAPDEVERLIDAARAEVDIAGLMTIPPAGESLERARPFFARMREMRERLARASGLALSELSMGMTDDFEIAIEEGATIVRVGRAVFGERTR